MYYRKDAVFMAVAGILASAGFALADNTAVKTPTLTLDTAPMADTAPSGLLMTGLDKVGGGDTLKKNGLNIYGWVEAGYTYDHRHHKTNAPILPGPFNHEFGGSGTAFFNPGGFSGGDRNHLMLNQVDVRFERLVKADKWDVGGMIELQYGTDAAGIHSNGLAIGNDSNDGAGGADFWRTGKTTDDRFNPQYQFDITQAYVDVNVPIGNGLKMRAGKFVTLMGYETIDPRGNPFYSHSYLFSAIPFTQTGLLGFYSINQQWAVAGGFTRGWDQTLEDNNAALDAIGQVIFTPNKQWSAILNWSCGPENDRDSSHYRTAIDFILVWQATDKLKFGLETIYDYDGGWNNSDGGGSIPGGVTHAYGDKWGAALYGQYVINDYCTFNARLEKFHDNANSFDALLTNQPISGDLNSLSNINTPTTVNFYSLTVGVTVKPFPKDPIGKNLVIRPEARYTYSEDEVFIEGTNSRGTFKDQLTFAADVIFSF